MLNLLRGFRFGTVAMHSMTDLPSDGRAMETCIALALKIRGNAVRLIILCAWLKYADE